MGDRKKPLWIVCVTCAWHDQFLARKILKRKPSPSALRRILLDAMKRPETGEPCQPERLMVKPKQGWEILRPQLAKIGITLLVTKDLEYPDGFPEWLDAVNAKREKALKLRSE